MEKERRKVSALVSAALVVFAAFGVAAQPPDEELDVAPPPVRIMSKGERDQLASQNEVKARTKLALELMNARLMRAEGFTAKSEYAETYKELGGFHALMDDTLDFLLDSGKTRDSVLNNFKRFELGLRSFAPRLGLIRRELPAEYDPYIKSLIKYLRDARSKAVEPLFGDTVAPQKRSD